MWIMTTRGFYSAVQDKNDSTMLVVRARCEADIKALAELLPESEPVKGVGTDYPWRLTCPKLAWTAVLEYLTLAELNYGNFKGAVTSKKHHDAYMRVWSALLALEDRPAMPKEWGPSPHSWGHTQPMQPQDLLDDVPPQPKKKLPLKATKKKVSR